MFEVGLGQGEAVMQRVARSGDYFGSQWCDRRRGASPRRDGEVCRAGRAVSVTRRRARPLDGRVELSTTLGLLCSATAWLGRAVEQQGGLAPVWDLPAAPGRRECAGTRRSGLRGSLIHSGGRAHIACRRQRARTRTHARALFARRLARGTFVRQSSWTVKSFRSRGRLLRRHVTATAYTSASTVDIATDTLRSRSQSTAVATCRGCQCRCEIATASLAVARKASRSYRSTTGHRFGWPRRLAITVSASRAT